jgi:hypothetical protein
MMYVHPPSMAKMKRDLDSTARPLAKRAAPIRRLSITASPWLSVSYTYGLALQWKPRLGSGVASRE